MCRRLSVLELAEAIPDFGWIVPDVLDQCERSNRHVLRQRRSKWICRTGVKAGSCSSVTHASVCRRSLAKGRRWLSPGPTSWLNSFDDGP